MAGMLVLHARATETSKWNASTALPSRAKKCSRARCEDRQEFGSFFFSRLLGIEVSYGNESCIVTFEALETMFNPQGTLHGGILATAIDISMGHLLHHVAGAGTTLEMKVQYLAPVTG